MIRLFATCVVFIAVVFLSACDDVPDLSLPNEPPVAVDDTVNIKQNEVTPINVLANDIDIDGDLLTISIAESTVNGELSLEENILTYTPNSFFVGTDTFSYQITDTAEHVATADVVINIARVEARAIFESVSAAGPSLLMIESTDPTTVVDLSASLSEMEMMLNWDISEQLQMAVVLTDADRLLLVPFDDPASVTDFSIDTTNGAVDGGLAVATSGNTAAFTLDNRYIEEIDLADGSIVDEVDTGFTESTLQPAFYSLTDAALVLQGTLGSGDEERAAIYYEGLVTPGQTAILDDPDNMGEVFTRRLSSSSNMVWLTNDTTMTVPGAAYSCLAPPPQPFSDLSQTSLVSPGATFNLNEESGVLPDPTSIISYNNASFSSNLYVAACPSTNEIVQIFEIPYLMPTDAIQIAMAADASDALWNVDISQSAERMVYVLEGDTGFRVIASDLSGDDPVETDITASVPEFQTFTDGADIALPQSVFNSDGTLWLFLVPVDDTLTRLGWIDLESLDVRSVDLPFTATNLVANGFFAIVQGETAGDGTAPIATIELFTRQLDTADVPGSVPEFVADPLNELESVIRLITVP
ncbi:MAG: Ig-like domain-containing protein [Gammaproteobacteria bacterium]|nr:Ig-like domain-containing protein [Gammaproteobacteria bacterium]